ncbi:PilW family protein [Trinickia caryophylli]|nr:PilW family protein [Trinickia caryophylli]WQE12858.1 PilW family protein [Trinickia caryophylli]GLU30580.1 hypothetical protein Busp01_04220 [Trinickia caryophylli]
MQRNRTASRGPIRGRSGHTLIELLVATGIGVLAVSAAASLYRMHKQMGMWSADAAAMRDAGATALSLLSQQLEMAGYAPPDSASLAEQTVPALFGCASGDFVRGDGTPVCAPGAAGSDMITVRYVDDAVATWPTSARQPTDCLGQGAGRPNEAAVVVNTFFVAKPDRGAEPELYCLGSGGPTRQPVVAGVERLHLRYWLRGSPAAAEASAIADDRWSEVVGVEVCVLVRGKISVAHARYFDCDGRPQRSADARIRQSFLRYVAIRNQEGAGV